MVSGRDPILVGAYRMTRLDQSRYLIREAEDRADIIAAQQLRFQAFRSVSARASQGLDQDRFDETCRHLMIEDRASGTLVATLRFQVLRDGRALADTYSAQFYDLSRLEAYPGPLMELGRICVDPMVKDADVLRLVLAGIGQLVVANAVRLILGCSSFAGIDPAPYGAAFALLQARHLAPPEWHPGERAAQIIRFDAQALPGGLPSPFDLKQARSTLPPLLRSYLTMGGWVSDHAVIDADLATLHVFTAVEVPAIPKGRARILRAMGQ